MRASSLHRVAHGKRVLTDKNGVASLNCCKIDCRCLERLVFPSHAASMLSVKSLSVFFLFYHRAMNFVFFIMRAAVRDRSSLGKERWKHY
jgi:hypothetical protein